MATVTLTIEGTLDTSKQTVVKSATIDDAILPYFFACYRQTYGQVQAANDDGLLKVDSNTQPVMRDMTDEETFAKYAAGISSGTLANVQSYLREIAAKKAVEQIPNIIISPT